MVNHDDISTKIAEMLVKTRTEHDIEAEEYYEEKLEDFIKNGKHVAQEMLQDVKELGLSYNNNLVLLVEESHDILSESCNTNTFENIQHIILDIDKNIPLLVDALSAYINDVAVTLPTNLLNSKNVLEVSNHRDYYFIRIISITNILQMAVSMFSDFMDDYTSTILLAVGNGGKCKEEYSINIPFNEVLRGDSEYHKIIEAIYAQFALIKTLIPVVYIIPLT